jgi:hypothetical protein
MTIREVTPPRSLVKKQIWFASLITQPLTLDNCIQPITPTNQEIEREAIKEIKPSPTLLPWQRIEIYNQQYWWRLLDIMHQLYPFVTRLFGYQDFNQSIAVPFLQQLPSNTWAIDHIGDRLPQWIRTNYTQDDKELVWNAIDLDYAFQDSFCRGVKPTIDIAHLQEDELSQLVSRRIYLQPYIHLFALDYNLFPFREEIIKEEPEYWIDHDFPELPKAKRYYGIVYRSKHDDVVWDNLSSAEFHVLWKFKEGCTIEDACEWLERQDAAMSDEAAAHIHFWFQEWTMRGWLTLEK